MAKITYPTRCEFLLGSCVALAGAAFGYGRFIEPKHIRRSSHQIPIRNFGKMNHVRLFHIADLHFGGGIALDFIEEAFMLGLRADSDIVVITGDLVERKIAEATGYRKLLSRIASRVPTYATMGNHDGGTWAQAFGGYTDTSLVRSLLNDAGVSVLHNECRTIETRSGSFNLVGVGDSWGDELDPESAFKKCAEGLPSLLMSHNPDTKDRCRALPWEAMLSGHTHGGQLRIPVVGATPFAPVTDRRYVSGLNRWEDRWIHPTNGVATTLDFRFNCRPEVSVLNFVGC